MMYFNPKWLVGKTIARVEMRPFKDGGRTLYDPSIIFTDGSHIAFLTQEGEDLYGVEILYVPPSSQPPNDVEIKT